MTLTAGMGTVLPAELEPLPQGPFTFSDAEAAERLLNRVSRDIAAVLDANDKDYADDLIPIYRWLVAVIADDKAEPNP